MTMKRNILSTVGVIIVILLLNGCTSNTLGHTSSHIEISEEDAIEIINDYVVKYEEYDTYGRSLDFYIYKKNKSSLKDIYMQYRITNPEGIQTSSDVFLCDVKDNVLIHHTIALENTPESLSMVSWKFGRYKAEGKIFKNLIIYIDIVFESKESYLEKQKQMEDELALYVQNTDALNVKELITFINNAHNTYQILKRDMWIVDVSYINGKLTYLMADSMAKDLDAWGYGAVCYVMVERAPSLIYEGYIMNERLYITKVGTGSYRSGYSVKECPIYDSTYTKPTVLTQAQNHAKNLCHILKKYGLTQKTIKQQYGEIIASYY